MYSSMGDKEIIYDPMETIPLTSAQDPSLDPMQSGTVKVKWRNMCMFLSPIMIGFNSISISISFLTLSISPSSGFTWYKPARSLEKGHMTGGHTWTISGHDMQILTSSVPAGQEIITEGRCVVSCFGLCCIENQNPLNTFCYFFLKKLGAWFSCIPTWKHMSN